MKENYDDCIVMLLHHEGGYVFDERDPGGETNLGVTKKVYEEYLGREVTSQEMKDLQPSDVKPLYKKLYWDWAVNSGTGRASKAVQKCCGAEQDGAIGPKTLALVDGQNTAYMIEKFGEIRQDFYESLSTFKHFGKGWTRRNKETTEKALTMI